MSARSCTKRRDARHVRVVDVLRLVGELVIVLVQPRGKEDDRNAVARVHVVIAATVQCSPDVRARSSE